MTESFGKYLAQQRELRAMPREEVAKATRIALPHLVALEEDRLEDLPGEAFAVGFIRSYADCIGLNVDDTVLRFQEQHPSALPVSENRREKRWRSPRWAPLAAQAVLLAIGFVIGWLLARH